LFIVNIAYFIYCHHTSLCLPKPWAGFPAPYVVVLFCVQLAKMRGDWHIVRFVGLQCDLEFFMFAVMKTFVTVISASTGRNDFIFDIWLWHGDLYRVSPFQVYRTSTSCLPCDPEEAEISGTKVWTDGRTNGRTNGRTDGQGDCNIAPTLWAGV
jgi:hypothetical protein